MDWIWNFVIAAAAAFLGVWGYFLMIPATA